MSDWWKAFSTALGKEGSAAEGQQQPAPGLRGRLEQELERLRGEEKFRRQAAAETSAGGIAAGGARDGRYRGEDGQQMLHEDLRALTTLLRWKLDVEAAPERNPARVDGLYFGVQRRPLRDDDGHVTQEVTWRLYLYRPCPHCKFLIPTIDLGDHREVMEAVKQETAGNAVQIIRSTEHLAGYLHDIQRGRPDQYYPRLCPSCRKLLKGGTL